MTVAANKDTLTLDRVQMLIGLSAIATGLSTLQRGKTQDACCLIGHGLDYLRAISEQEKRQ